MIIFYLFLLRAQKSISPFYSPPLQSFVLFSLSALRVILFLLHFLNGVASRLFFHHFLFWGRQVSPFVLLGHFGLECVSYWLFKTVVVVLNLHRITKIIYVVVSSGLVHHRHVSIKSIITSKTQSCQIFLIEIAFLLHLFDCGKHCTFLLLGLPSYCETSLKHFLLFIHQLFTPSFIILNLDLYFLSLILINLTYTLDVLEFGFPLQELHLLVEGILPFSLLLSSLQRPLFLFTR